jgi:hypothetical protein
MEENLKHLIKINIEKRIDEPKKTYKQPIVAVQCDVCSSLSKQGNRYKLADKEDFDLCEQCFISREIECTSEEPSDNKHPFWIVKGFEDYEFAKL